MKNKLVTKIIIFAVCVSTLLVTLVVPSFAYTYGNTSAYNNSEEQFTLPTTMLVLENLNTSVTDVPGYFYVPTSDYYGRGERVLTSVDSVINNNNVNFAVLNSVTSSNVYENNGFVHSGDVKFKTLSNSVDFNSIYDLIGFRVEDWWFDSSLNSSASSSIYNSISVYLPNVSLYQQWDYENLITVESVPVQYRFKYYDYDGVYHETSFVSKYFPDKNGYVMIPYFPDTIYPDIEQYGYPLRGQDVYFFQDIAYLDLCEVRILNSLCTPNFLVPSSETNIDCKGTYISRLLKPNYIGESLDTLLDNFTETQYNNGYDEGYDDGREIGYNEGYAEGSLNPSTPFDGILLAVDTFMNWQFIPGISIGVILSIVIGVSLLIAFLKVFAGG